MPAFIKVAVGVGALSAVPSVAGAQDSSRGYPCMGDCSGHEAGYEWAEKQGITDPDECGGNSSSFIEGCQAYGEEQEEEQELEDNQDFGLDAAD